MGVAGIVRVSWAQKQKTHAVLGELCVGVSPGGEGFERLRLEQTDTGATARHATTHATEGGGVDLLHQVLSLRGWGWDVKVLGWFWSHGAAVLTGFCACLGFVILMEGRAFAPTIRDFYETRV
jgi:hypothetical protein